MESADVQDGFESVEKADLEVTGREKLGETKPGYTGVTMVEVQLVYTYAHHSACLRGLDEDEDVQYTVRDGSERDTHQAVGTFPGLGT
jgi:hypothetical protein